MDKKQSKQRAPALHMEVKCWKLIEITTHITHKVNDWWMAAIPYESIGEVLDRDFDDEMGFPWQVEWEGMEGKWQAYVCDVDGNRAQFYPADGMDELYFGIEYVPRPAPMSAFLHNLLEIPSLLNLIKT